MCAIKLVHLGNDINDIKTYNVEEKSYSPIANIEGLDKKVFNAASVLRDIAIVATLNNKAGLKYDG
jgi:hypothetical protein